MSKRKETIGRKLMSINASWAVSSAKHWQHGYMVMPNNSNPHRDSIKYFNTLDQIEHYIKLIKELRSMPEEEQPKYQIVPDARGNYFLEAV